MTGTEKVVIAEVLRTRGIKGEIAVRSLTDVPGRLEKLRSVCAQLRDGSDVPLEVEQAWPHKEGWVLKFAGVDSIEAAERFRGADLCIPFEERAELPAGEFYQSDLLGCTVFDTVTGSPVGLVAGWQEFGGPPLMEVNDAGRERLIPFVPALCSVDLAGRVIRMPLPEGLLDL